MTSTYRNLGSGDLDKGDRDLDLDIGDRRSCITFRGGGNGLKLRLLDLLDTMYQGEERVGRINILSCHISQ